MVKSAGAERADHLEQLSAERRQRAEPIMAFFFSGSSPWAQGDTITAAVANDYAGLFQYGTDRLFQMRQKGLYFPTTGSNLINDNLIG